MADRLKLLSISLGNFSLDLIFEFLFERHDQLDRVERISPKVIEERSLGRNLLLVNIELINDDFINALLDGFLVGHGMNGYGGTLHIAIPPSTVKTCPVT